MAKKVTRQKVGFGDLVSLAKSGWTPEETNALLDRLDKMGDPNEPLLDDGDDDDETDISDDNLDISDDDDSDMDDNSDDQDSEDDKSSDKDSKGVQKNLDRMKALAYDDIKVENERLKKEITRLRSKNRNKDLSSEEDKKSNSESLIDALQSCF